MKTFFTIGLLMVLVLAFQNCGVQEAGPGLFSSGDGTIESFSTLDPSGDELFISIKDSNPLTVNFVYNTSSIFNVAGTCGVGGYESNFVDWELREGSGNQAVVGRGRIERACQAGRFILAIPKTLEIDRRYTLSIEIFGLTDTEDTVQSPLPTGRSTVDVVAISEDTQALGSGESPAEQYCRITQRQRFLAGLDQRDEANCRPYTEEELFGPGGADGNGASLVNQ